MLARTSTAGNTTSPPIVEVCSIRIGDPAASGVRIRQQTTRERVIAFNSAQAVSAQDTKVLDVGSGTVRVPGRNERIRVRCFALAPDPIAVEHALTAGRRGRSPCGNTMIFRSDKGFRSSPSQVLEHLPDPSAL